MTEQAQCRHCTGSRPQKRTRRTRAAAAATGSNARPADAASRRAARNRRFQAAPVASGNGQLVDGVTACVNGDCGNTAKRFATRAPPLRGMRKALYGGPSSSGEWGGNILQGSIKSGETLSLTISDTTTCKYDFRYEVDNSEPLEEYGVDICAIDGQEFVIE